MIRGNTGPGQTWSGVARIVQIVLMLTIGLLLVISGSAAADGAPGASAPGAPQCLTCHDRLTGLGADQNPGSTPGLELAGFAGSVHGNLPCTSCHRDILANARPHRIAATRPDPGEICLAGCHQDTVAGSYARSFHGTARRLGSTRTAACQDCHGAHDVLPVGDPLSRVSQANLPATCGRCHQGPQVNFARGEEHTVVEDRGDAFVLYAVWQFFVALIIFDTVKDGPIAISTLVRRLGSAWRHRRRDRRDEEREG